jgi:hypothetical protein
MGALQGGGRVRVGSHFHRSGFTLVEITASSSLFVILVILVGIAFQQSDRSWSLGLDSVHSTSSGRAVVALLARDIESAVCSPTMTFTLLQEAAVRNDTFGPTLYGNDTHSQLSFVTLKNNTNRQAAVEEIIYRLQASTNNIGTYDLVKLLATDSIRDNQSAHCYQKRNWATEASLSAPVIVAENVAGFTATIADGSVDYCSQDHSNALPMAIDICLELLDGIAAARISRTVTSSNTITPLERQALGNQLGEYVDRGTRRYARRVYLTHATGYRPR